MTVIDTQWAFRLGFPLGIGPAGLYVGVYGEWGVECGGRMGATRRVGLWRCQFARVLA